MLDPNGAAIKKIIEHATQDGEQVGAGFALAIVKTLPDEVGKDDEFGAVLVPFGGADMQTLQVLAQQAVEMTHKNADAEEN